MLLWLICYYSQSLSHVVSSGDPKMAPILDILFKFLCWGIDLIISSYLCNFCYQIAKNLGSTRCMLINNVKSNNKHNVLFISFHPGNSCHPDIRPITVLYLQQWNLVFAFFIFSEAVASEGTFFSTCSKILQQCIEHFVIVFWNTNLVE